MALIIEDQGEQLDHTKLFISALMEQQQPQKKTFYVIKKKCRYNSWLPISYFDDEGHFRGTACFTSFWEAIQYMQKYEDRLIKNHLKESKRFSNDNQRRLNGAELKLFLDR